MGLNFPLAALLSWARRERGLAAHSLVSMGRLEVTMPAPRAAELLRRHPEVPASATGASGYADDLLRAFTGASTVASLDVSDYQNATIRHDLNIPVPPELHDTFDLLGDGGTLEHIFDIPVALRNYRDLVRPGGWVAICTPGNNYMGHGFYQFSAELFFNRFSRENGFELHYLGLAVHPYPSAKLSSHCTFYEVSAPSAVGARVALVDDAPALLLVLARKLTGSDERQPGSAIQSDYQRMHAKVAETAARPTRSDGIIRLARLLPEVLANTLRGWRELRTHSLSNHRHYRKHDASGFRGLPVAP